jgi:hypothetical protein
MLKRNIQQAEKQLKTQRNQLHTVRQEHIHVASQLAQAKERHDVFEKDRKASLCESDRRCRTWKNCIAF